MSASHLHNNNVSKHAKEIFQEYNLKRAWKPIHIPVIFLVQRAKSVTNIKAKK
jgi:hypothetical protein